MFLNVQRVASFFFTELFPLKYVYCLYKILMSRATQL